MATLYKRKDGRANYRVCYTDIDGKRYKVNTGTVDRLLAQLWLSKVEGLLAKAKLG